MSNPKEDGMTVANLHDDVRISISASVLDRGSPTVSIGYATIETLYEALVDAAENEFAEARSLFDEGLSGTSFDALNAAQHNLSSAADYLAALLELVALDQDGES